MKTSDPDAPFQICWRSAEGHNTVQLVRGGDFRLGSWNIVHYCNSSLQNRLEDLARIASAVFFVDRLARRVQRGQGQGARDIDLSVEVSDVDFWSSPQVSLLLTEIVADTLGGDFWNFSFLATKCSPPEQYRWLPFRNLESATVCLYSGGLDSAAGLVKRLTYADQQPVFPVSVWHQPKQRDLIFDQLGVIRGRMGLVQKPIIVRAALIKPPPFKLQERSQRCRAFLFASMGGIAAALLGASRIEVYESDIGALNLPLMSGMVGWKKTRGCNPKFLRLMSKLLHQVAERKMEYVLPHLSRTKGEVVESLRETSLGGLTATTVSCVHYPLRERPAKQCGVCAACLLRRQALLTAGVEDPPDQYKYDAFGTAERFQRIPRDHLQYIKAMLWQVAKLSELGTDGRFVATLRSELRKSELPADESSLYPWIDLFGRYRREWLALADRLRYAGVGWANWIGSDQAVA